MISFYLLFIIVLLILIYNNNIEHFSNQDVKLGIIVTTYNPGVEYLDKCLQSIENQTYKNYTVSILDDATNKDTVKTRDVIKDYCKKNNWVYKFRNENIGPLGGRIDAINNLEADDEMVIVSIDGDDELYDNNVFSLLNNYYKNENILITFGNYVDQYQDKLSKPKIKCKTFNFNKISKDNSFRKSQWIYSHLKTFKYKLYKRISHHDLKKDGIYIKSATDMALMYPMLEMSNGKYKCISEVLYKYNKVHPESHNVSKSKFSTQSDNAKFVKNLPEYNSSYSSDNNFKIIVTTYNPGLEYIKDCLISIANQKYRNYDVCVIDDCSTRNSVSIKNFIIEICEKNKWKYIFNKDNLGMINSFINGVEYLNCQDNDILVSIDGDDKLFNEDVLTLLNDKYDYKTLITFGNLVTADDMDWNQTKCNRDWDYIGKNKLFREKWHYSHLKTFRYKLFKKINKNDLKKDNKYVKSATDRALMYPMLEMSGNKFKCISDPLYIYNRSHSESNNINKQKKTEQLQNADYFTRKKKYDTIY